MDENRGYTATPLQWRHNGRDSVSNHQPHDCFLNRLFWHRSKKTSKPRVTGLCAGNSPEASNKWPVTRIMFSFDDVIMTTKRYPNFVITAPADAPAPDGARPSVSTVLTTKLQMFSSKCRWVWRFLLKFRPPYDVIKWPMRSREFSWYFES